MIFVIGGRAQGKLAFVRNTFKMDDDAIVVVPEEASEEWHIGDAKGNVLVGYHRLVRIQLQRHEDVDAELEKLIAQYRERIIISNEVGMGVVPVEKEERTYRDVVGRAHQKLAAAADEVYAVTCGLGVRIK